jgi:hypothetical protein
LPALFKLPARTPKEYLQDSVWLMETGCQFMEPGKEYVHETMPKPIVAWYLFIENQ